MGLGPKTNVYISHLQSEKRCDEIGDNDGWVKKKVEGSVETKEVTTSGSMKKFNFWGYLLNPIFIRVGFRFN